MKSKKVNQRFSCFPFKKSKKGQIWIETVIYTLIFLTLIGMVLAFATPAIQKQKDKTTIQLTIKAMSDLDNTIQGVKQTGPGNVGTIDFLINQGSFTIDAVKDEIIFLIEDSSYKASEVGRTITVGPNMKMRTKDNGKNYDVSIILSYTDSSIDIRYNFDPDNAGASETTKEFSRAKTPYQFMVENKGRVADDKVYINIYEV